MVSSWTLSGSRMCFCPHTFISGPIWKVNESSDLGVSVRGTQLSDTQPHPGAFMLRGVTPFVTDKTQL